MLESIAGEKSPQVVDRFVFPNKLESLRIPFPYHVWYIYLLIYHKNQANAGKHTIHGWFRIALCVVFFRGRLRTVDVKNSCLRVCWRNQVAPRKGKKKRPKFVENKQLLTKRSNRFFFLGGGGLPSVYNHPSPVRHGKSDQRFPQFTFHRLWGFCGFFFVDS